MVPLPPPDPHEMLGADEGVSFAGPMAVFMSGSPTPAADRLADAILDARPGVLFVGTRA